MFSGIERLTSRLGEKYKLYIPRQGRYNATMLWRIYCNAELENGGTVGLQVLFAHWIVELLTENKNNRGHLRKDVVEEVIFKFKGLLFYGEINKDKTIQLTTDVAKHTEEKINFDDFEITRAEPFAFKCTGYPNLNADIHTKAEVEVLRVLYENYGKDVNNAEIKQKVWFNNNIIQRVLDDLKSLGHISNPSSQSSILTASGKQYYMNSTTNKSDESKSSSSLRFETKDKVWDFFICHASEDKNDAAIPIYNGLLEMGYKVWLDKYALKLGDSLRRKVEDGLKNSKYGVVILSPSFFAKEWPQRELDGLFELEQDGKKRILPVWHNIDYEDVKGYSSILAGRLGVKTSEGIKIVVDKIIDAMSD